jgi:hypothetical protein
MRKLNYYLGYIAAFLTAVAFVFKLNHWPLTGIIMDINLILLSIYFPLFIIDKMKNAEGKTASSYVVAAICSGLITLGVLFKINHWPVAGILLTSGLAGFSLVFLPWLYIEKSKVPGAPNLMNAAGALGLALFGLAILGKLMHWPGPAFLFVAAVALVFLIYFPMFMMSAGISDEVKVSKLRDTFFALIIGSLMIFFILGIIRSKPAPPVTDPAATEQVTN